MSSLARSRDLVVDGAGVGAIAVIALAAWFAVAAPWTRAHHRTVELRGLVEKRQQDLDAERDRLRSLRSACQALEAQLAERSGKLLPAGQLNHRINELARLASDCELTVRTLTPGKAHARPRYVTVPIQMQGQGSFPACVRFIAGVADRFADTAIPSLMITGHPEKLAGASEFSFELAWHALPEAAPAGPGGTARPVVADAADSERRR